MRGVIPVFRPFVEQAEIDAVTAVLRSGWWGSGPRTAEFEGRFAERVEARHVVGTSSGTAALQLAVMALAANGKEIVTTSLTFVATNHAILLGGARPVFADVEPDTLNLDPRDVERKVGPDTAAIMAVDYGGHPADLDALRAIGQARGIPVIEDAAHAAGAVYRGRPVGSISQFTCFSFHAVKNVAMAEGGAVAVGDPELAARLRRLRWLGLSRDAWARRADAGTPPSWGYDLDEIGIKANMNDVSAAIGLVQLDRLDGTNARRRAIVAHYQEAFAGLDWLTRPVERPDVCSAWHLYAVRVPDRERFMAHLRARGVETAVHYQPNHLFRAYAPYRSILPVTEREAARLVTLPLFPGLTDAESDRIVDAVRSFPV